MQHAHEPSTPSTVDTIVVDPVNKDTAREVSSPTEFAPSNKPQVHSRQTLDPLAMPAYIPFGPREARTLVLCFDGTGDQFDSDNSNIVQLATMLKKDDKEKQLVYYQAGIGTYITPAIATPLMSKISKLADEMLAWNLDAHVMGGYEFLMQNYRNGDKICIFGFSRGAYTARSLAGMVHKVGLLPSDNRQQIPFAYKMYTRTDDIGWDQSNSFKAAFSADVKIEFVGVWDTVDSVGIIPKRLPFTTSNTIVKKFRHAVSLDEHRSKFKANLWNRATEKELGLGINIAQAKRERLEELRVIGNDNDNDNDNGSSDASTLLKNGKRKTTSGPTLLKLDTQSDKAMDRYEAMYSARNDTDVEEVWFAGCHCDIGGGSVENGTRYSLARIPLRWMVRECFKANTGILFDTDSLYDIGMDPSTLWPYVTPRPPALLERARQERIQRPITQTWSEWFGHFFRTSASKHRAAVAAAEKRAARKAAFISEEDEELNDALSPKYDQLGLSRWWWALEVFPVSMRYQTADNDWVSYIGINLGKGRDIPKLDGIKLKFHRSVQLRMEAQSKDGGKYEPKASFSVQPHWTA